MPRSTQGTVTCEGSEAEPVGSFGRISVMTPCPARMLVSISSLKADNFVTVR